MEFPTKDVFDWSAGEGSLFGTAGKRKKKKINSFFLPVEFIFEMNLILCHHHRHLPVKVVVDVFLII
jgi:hypothetical protein